MKRILENLKNCTNRESTANNYQSIWRSFNKFLIKLDRKPALWEDRTALYCAFLIDNGLQSATLKSYVSAIKKTLVNDGYNWQDSRILLNSLAKSCRLINDKVHTRMPINGNLLEIILFEIERMYSDQYYLEILYKTILLLGYYGLLRIGELTTGTHPIKAKNVHIAQNKPKLLLILYSSKTHGRESRPQEVKITGNSSYNAKSRNFCPFLISREYLAIRGNYIKENEPFFIFRDKAPVTPPHVRTVLRSALESLKLNPLLYNCHSLRIGRASDLLIKYNWPISRVKLAGRWRSNIVFQYIRDIK